MTNNRIIGTGSYLPSKVLTNSDLEKIVETNDAWIVERTGIKERRVAADNELTSDLATNAALLAIEDAKLSKDDIDLIILATTTPDNTFPATAVDVQSKLGIKTAAAFDIQAVCSGFVYALSTADALLKSGNYKNALVIGAETITRLLDWNDRTTCILFGDGAGAVILSPTQERNKGILSSKLYSEAETKDLLYTDGGASLNQKSGFIKMEGQEVFKHAVRKLASVTEEALQIAGIRKDDVDWVIPHQANQRILDATIKKLDISDKKLISTVANHANTSAASIPLAMDVARKDGRIKDNDIIAVQAIGGGLTWGSAIIRF